MEGAITREGAAKNIREMRKALRTVRNRIKAADSESTKMFLRPVRVHGELVLEAMRREASRLPR